MKGMWKLAAGLCTAMALTACGGGGGGGGTVATPVASDVAPITLNAATGAVVAQALAGQTITFPSGLTLGGVALPGPVTLTFTAGNGFTLTDGNGATASGNVTFSSIIFDVTSPGATGLTAGALPPVAFTIDLNTSSQSANGESTSVQSTITIGSATSTIVTITVTISSDGTIQITGHTIGSTSVSTPTGATGAG